MNLWALSECFSIKSRQYVFGQTLANCGSAKSQNRKVAIIGLLNGIACDSIIVVKAPLCAPWQWEFHLFEGYEFAQCSSAAWVIAGAAGGENGVVNCGRLIAEDGKGWGLKCTSNKFVFIPLSLCLVMFKVEQSATIHMFNFSSLKDFPTQNYRSWCVIIGNGWYI